MLSSKVIIIILNIQQRAISTLPAARPSLSPPSPLPPSKGVVERSPCSAAVVEFLRRASNDSYGSLGWRQVDGVEVGWRWIPLRWLEPPGAVVLGSAFPSVMRRRGLDPDGR